MARYFNDDEIRGLQRQFVELLDRCREEAGIPFVITSGFRDPSTNVECGGVQDSAHEKGLGVDIRCQSSNERFKIVKAAMSLGFERIGIYNLHIHLDIDETKPKQVVWVGLSH